MVTITNPDLNLNVANIPPNLMPQILALLNSQGELNIPAENQEPIKLTLPAFEYNALRQLIDNHPEMKYN